MTPQALLDTLVGAWSGTCRTWFQPGEPVDTSTVRGEFRAILAGRFVRHTYTGTMQGRPRTGEETICFNAAKDGFQVAWFDEFHMNYGIMFSEGPLTETGFVVKGAYDVGPEQPPWGWRTVFDLKDEDHLTITAYNLSPDGDEAKAVETVYTRAKS